MVECSFTNVVGSSLVSVKEFLDIQATIECGFTLKCLCDMIRTHSLKTTFILKQKKKIPKQRPIQFQKAPLRFYWSLLQISRKRQSKKDDLSDGSNEIGIFLFSATAAKKKDPFTDSLNLAKFFSFFMKASCIKVFILT